MNFQIGFLFLEKKCHGDFDRNYTDSVDHFGQYCYFNKI